MAVPPPPPTTYRAGHPGELEPEMAEDARSDAGLHEGAADALLALVAPMLHATTPYGEREVRVIDDRDGALLRAQMAQAEATLALGFRLGQIAAVAERIADALEAGQVPVGEMVSRVAEAHAEMLRTDGAPGDRL